MKHAYLFLLLPVLLLGMFLRAYRLDAKSLWLDEIGHAVVAEEKTLAAVIRGTAIHAAAAPLDYVFLHLITPLGTADFLLRFLPACYGVLAIAFMYRLGNLLLERPAGIIGAFLLAMSPYHIAYSQEVRFYSLFVLTSLAVLVFFHEAVMQRTWRAWAKFTFALATSLYAHYFSILLVFSLALFLAAKALRAQLHREKVALERWDPIPGFLASVLAAGILALPLLRAFLAAPGSHGFQGSLNLLKSLQDIVRRFTSGVGTHPASWVTGLYVTLLCAGAYVLFRQSSIEFGLLLIVPIAGALGADAWSGYFFDARQVIFVLPVFLLAVTAGILGVSSVLVQMVRKMPVYQRATRPIVLSLISLGAFGSTNAILLPQYYWSPKENWRDAAAFIAANYESGDVIATFSVPPEHYKYGIGYYLSQELAEELAIVHSAQDVQSVYWKHARTWIVVSHWAPTPEVAEVQEWLAQEGFWQQVNVSGIQVAYKRRGEPVSVDETIVLLRNAVARKPGNAVFAMLLANIYNQQGNVTEASELYQSIIQSNPDQWWPHYVMGEIASQRGLWNEALFHFRRAARLVYDPKARQDLGSKISDIRNNLRRMQLHVGNGQEARFVVELDNVHPQELHFSYYDYPSLKLEVYADERPIAVIGGGPIGWQTAHLDIPFSPGAAVPIRVKLTGSGTSGITEMGLEAIPADITFEDIPQPNWTDRSYKHMNVGDKVHFSLALATDEPRVLQITYFDSPKKELEIWVRDQLLARIGGKGGGWTTTQITVPASVGAIVPVMLKATGLEASGVSEASLTTAGEGNTR